MTDLKQLINLNVELEGLLKVLHERNSVEAKSLLADKFRRYSALITEFLDNDDDVTEAFKEFAPASEELYKEAEYVEVKEQEAQETELVGEGSAAVAAIERGADEMRHAPRCLAASFTLNDKYRFIREVFGGNESDFADTLAVLDDMDSFKEAEDYIVSDLMLDSSNPDVADFLDIIASNF